MVTSSDVKRKTLVNYYPGYMVLSPDVRGEALVLQLSFVIK